jgi:hypothetical protein
MSSNSYVTLMQTENFRITEVHYGKTVQHTDAKRLVPDKYVLETLQKDAQEVSFWQLEATVCPHHNDTCIQVTEQLMCDLLSHLTLKSEQYDALVTQYKDLCNTLANTRAVAEVGLSAASFNHDGELPHGLLPLPGTLGIAQGAVTELCGTNHFLSKEAAKTALGLSMTGSIPAVMIETDLQTVDPILSGRTSCSGPNEPSASSKDKGKSKKHSRIDDKTEEKKGES